MKFPQDFAPPKGVSVTEYETVINWCHNGVLYIYAKPEIQHHLEDAMRQVAFMQKMTNNFEGKVIIDIREAPPLSVKARNYYGSDDGQRWAKKTCLIIKSPVNRVIGNFYFGYFNKKIKTRMVKDANEGLVWLREV